MCLTRLYLLRLNVCIFSLENDNPENATPLPLRTDQLDFRRQEIYIAYDAFCRFIRNDPSLEFATIDDSQIDTTSWSIEDAGTGARPVCCEQNVSLAGHSFGGCTVVSWEHFLLLSKIQYLYGHQLSILSTEPPSGYSHIPVTNALILDPWLEPLPTPGPTPILQIPPPPSSNTLTPLARSIQSSSDTTISNEDQESGKRDDRLPRMLVLNSEVFTLWKDHYARLQEIVRAWEPQGKRIITLGE